MKRGPLVFPAAPVPPDPPAWLDGRALEVFGEWAPEAAKAGTLTPLDLSGFAVLCTLQAHVEALTELPLQHDGGRAPLLEVADLLLQYLDAYLMTPASRAEKGL